MSMERLTERERPEFLPYVSCKVCGKHAITECFSERDCIQTLADRLAAIEDILGDTYDLDRLRELVEADRAGRCVVLPLDIGDSVFDSGLGDINEWEVSGFSIGECYFDPNVCGDLYDGKLVIHTKGKSLVGVRLDFPESTIGDYVFPDYDATEAALEKMKEAQA